MKKIILVTFILAGVIFGQDISYNKEFRVNPDISGDQRLPQITSLTNGNWVVCWEEKTEDTYGSDILAQIFNKNRKRIGPKFLVNSYTTNKQNGPSITSLSEDRFIITWESENQDGSGSGIFAQIFDESGNKIGDEFQVNDRIKGSQFLGTVTNLSNNKFIICWEGAEQPGGNFDIYAKIFNDGGNEICNEFKVNTYDKQDQGSPSLTNLSKNRFVICWESWGQDSSGDGIFAQIFSNQGNKIKDEFQINSVSSGDQSSPSITNISNNRFVASWDNTDNFPNENIKAQIFSTQGNKISDEFIVNTYTQESQCLPSIEKLSDDKFIICWVSIGQDGDDSGIFAQIFNNDGNRIGKEFQVNTYYRDWQEFASITNMSGHEFAICWQSGWQNNAKNEIYAKLYILDKVDLKTFKSYSPQMDETLDTIPQNFTWQSPHNTPPIFSWEVTYDLYISQNENFKDPLIYSDISDTTFQIPDTLKAGKTYFWKVLAEDWEGDSIWSNNVNGFYISEEAENTALKDRQTNTPDKLKLHQNHPNPFNPVTNITYDLPPGNGQYKVIIKVYDIQGRLVKVLKNDKQSPGRYTVKWNGTDQSGQKVSNGVYIYSLQAGNYRSSGKMLFLK